MSTSFGLLTLTIYVCFWFGHLSSYYIFEYVDCRTPGRILTANLWGRHPALPPMFSLPRQRLCNTTTSRTGDTWANNDELLCLTSCQVHRVTSGRSSTVINQYTFQNSSLMQNFSLVGCTQSKHMYTVGNPRTGQKGWLVSWLVLWTKPTTKDDIRAEHELHSISKLFISQVIGFLSLFIFRRHSTREPAHNKVTYFILQAYTGTSISSS